MFTTISGTFDFYQRSGHKKILPMPLASQNHRSLAGSWGACSVLSTQPHLKTHSDFLHARSHNLAELPTLSERLHTYRQDDQMLPSEDVCCAHQIFVKEDNQVSKVIQDSRRWETNVCSLNWKSY